jgi:DedD protein
MKTYDESDDLNHSDTEITLGMRSILGIFFGLALICGVFFGFGYSVGRGNTSKAAPSGQTGLPVLGTTSPSPVRTVVEGAAPSDTDAPDDSQYGAGSDGAPHKSAGIVLQPKPSAASASAIPAATETAEGASGNTGSPGDTSIGKASSPRPLGATTPTSPALASATPSSAIMVQIAAVSHRQDADVLISALKKLGYDASVQTGTDNLLHVQVGPFATRDQARVMRTKLLNDGYNAIVK